MHWAFSFSGCLNSLHFVLRNRYHRYSSFCLGGHLLKLPPHPYSPHRSSSLQMRMETLAGRLQTLKEHFTNCVATLAFLVKDLKQLVQDTPTCHTHLSERPAPQFTGERHGSSKDQGPPVPSGSARIQPNTAFELHIDLPVSILSRDQS